MTQKQPIEYYKASPEKYRVTDAGLVYDLEEKKIVTQYPELNPNAITPSTSQHLHTLRKAQGARSRLMGLIDAGKVKGLDFPDPESMTDEEVIKAAGDVVRLITKHTALTYLESKNLRGMGEIFGKLLEPFAEDPRARDLLPLERGVIAAPEILLELLNAIETRQQGAIDRARAIDIQAWEAATQSGKQ